MTINCDQEKTTLSDFYIEFVQHQPQGFWFAKVYENGETETICMYTTNLEQAKEIAEKWSQ